jgi:hypothetical protein
MIVCQFFSTAVHKEQYENSEDDSEQMAGCELTRRLQPSESLRRIDHIGRREAEMQPSGRWTDMLRHGSRERDHIVLGALLVRHDGVAFRPRVLLAGALFGAGLFPQAVQRADSAHLAWVSGVVVALVPAALVELAHLWRPAWKSAAVGLGAGLAVIAAVALLFPTYTARRYIGAVQDSVHLPKSIEITNDGRSWYVGSDPSFAKSITSLVQAVGREVKPGGRVIVGNTDMRRVPYNDTFLYYLLPHFVPGTASMEFEPGLTNRRGTTLSGEMERADAASDAARTAREAAEHEAAE